MKYIPFGRLPVKRAACWIAVRNGDLCSAPVEVDFFARAKKPRRQPTRRVQIGYGD